MAFTVERIAVLKDNYVFVLYDQQAAAVVDPAVAPPVLDFLRQRDLKLTAIFNTHHHGDHVGGNQALLQQFPQAQVYGSRQDQGRIPGQTVCLDDGDAVDFGGEQGRVYFVPGHTRGHIAYYFPGSGHLFCGDTLFAGGCGRLFEGTAAQLLASLDQFAQLPPETLVWCAHEYTLNNLKFALSVEKDNLELQARFDQTQRARQQGRATIPTTIGLERATNPFLRVDQPSLQTTQTQDRVQVFTQLRTLKDHF
ncbi:hydroxyacylglutathione hydrolase [Candidatus Cyanaurora vandensis]|uniref:hydroxyacylglutathione hydrolase n=1 Tax=Candidatus Cyanaurora vandensis TaxID=2714958 RepID=UPI002579D417|nr:hydroxyacylglutathione hydrolase [Candidatus Cyanaurora vandensis]